MKMKKVLSAMAAVSLAISSNLAFAASDGVLSDANSTSVGTSDVSVTIPARVQITGFADMTIDDWKIGDGDIDLTNDICVYTNSAAGYKVTASGSSEFGLSSPDNSHIIPYTLQWNDGSTDTALSHGIETAAFNNANNTSANCGGTTNSVLKFNILASDLESAPGVDSAYVDTITVTISPA